MTFTEADRRYPFDPKVKAEWYVGLEKLRAFDDPKMRRSIYELYRATGGVTEPPVDNSEERFP